MSACVDDGVVDGMRGAIVNRNVYVRPEENMPLAKQRGKGTAANPDRVSSVNILVGDVKVIFPFSNGK